MLWDSLSTFEHLHVVESLQELLGPHFIHVGNIQATLPCINMQTWSFLKCTQLFGRVDIK
jgi:hypothetical protein